jgi:hypothetical protein
MAVLEPTDAFGCSTVGIGEIGEDAPGVDRRQLIRIADQHERRVLRQRVEQRVDELEVEHRSLVDDERADRQRAARVVREAAVTAVAEQAM